MVAPKSIIRPEIRILVLVILLAIIFIALVTDTTDPLAQALCLTLFPVVSTLFAIHLTDPEFIGDVVFPTPPRQERLEDVAKNATWTFVGTSFLSFVTFVSLLQSI